MSDAEIIRRLLKDMEMLKTEVRRLESLKPLFWQGNRNATATVISANTNNLDPGNYDFIILAPTSAFNVTGISGGVAGRKLHILSFGAGSINFTHQDALSTDINRLNNITGATVNKAINQSYVAWYSGTRWIQII